MTKKKLRLGVIGAGSWAVACLLPGLERRSDVIEFVGVARTGKEELQYIQRRFGFRMASEDYRDVIDASIDICVVASPAGCHYEHTRAALEGGAHVLVEKPVTILPADAWALVALADEKKLHLVCSFGWNYRPLIVRSKELLLGEGVGDIEYLNISMSSPIRELLSNKGTYRAAAPETKVRPETWTDPRLSGGGYGQGQLSHALALALWLTELRGNSVFSLMSSSLDAPVEFYNACAIAYSDGVIGALAGAASHVGYRMNRAHLEVEIIGSEGQYFCDIQHDEAYLYLRGQKEFRLDVTPAEGAYNCDGPVNTLVELALGRPVPNLSPGWLGAHTVEILDAAYRSARSGLPESVVSYRSTR